MIFIQLRILDVVAKLPQQKISATLPFVKQNASGKI
jgi:hypothetical protein